MQGVLIVCKNPRRKVGGLLDVTFADEICEVAETQTTDELDWSPKKSETLFKKPREDCWWTVKDYWYYVCLSKFADKLSWCWQPSKFPSEKDSRSMIGPLCVSVKCNPKLVGTRLRVGHRSSEVWILIEVKWWDLVEQGSCLSKLLGSLIRFNCVPWVCKM